MRQITLLFFVFALFSCTSDSSNSEELTTSRQDNIATYGGCLKLSLTENIISFDPIQAFDINSRNIVAQIHQGLVKLNPENLSVEPSIAKSWEVDSTGNVYTFNLRDDVYFHKDPCFEKASNKLTADDVAFTFNRAADKETKNNKVYDFVIKNKIKDIEVMDEYTIQITLEAPNLSFLQVLSMPQLSIVSKKAIGAYGAANVVGAGPFMVSKSKTIRKNNVILLKNNQYFEKDANGSSLPYLDTVQFSVYGSKKVELRAFEEADLHVIKGLPNESVNKILEKEINNFQTDPPLFVLGRSPKMATTYFLLNSNCSKALKNIKVRKALNYAIDKGKIVDDVLKGEAYGPADKGITPPFFKGYKINELDGFPFDVEKAKKLMADAGFPEGKNFPKLELTLNSGGSKNIGVALEVKRQWKRYLGVDVHLEIVSLLEKIDNRTKGSSDVYSNTWVADYPDPESFLSFFDAKNNQVGQCYLTNEEYNNFYNQALQASSIESRYHNFLKAEQIILDQACVIPLFYAEDYILQKSTVNNYKYNAMAYEDLSCVYLAAPKPVSPNN